MFLKNRFLKNRFLTHPRISPEPTLQTIGVREDWLRFKLNQEPNLWKGVLLLNKKQLGLRGPGAVAGPAMEAEDGRPLATPEQQLRYVRPVGDS